MSTTPSPMILVNKQEFEDVIKVLEDFKKKMSIQEPAPTDTLGKVEDKALLEYLGKLIRSHPQAVLEHYIVLLEKDCDKCLLYNYYGNLFILTKDEQRSVEQISSVVSTLLVLNFTYSFYPKSTLCKISKIIDNKNARFQHNVCNASKSDYGFKQ